MEDSDLDLEFAGSDLVLDLEDVDPGVPEVDVVEGEAASLRDYPGPGHRPVEAGDLDRRVARLRPGKVVEVGLGVGVDADGEDGGLPLLYHKLVLQTRKLGTV